MVVSRHKMRNRRGGHHAAMTGFAGLDGTAPSITGIDVVDQVLYNVKGKLDDFQTAMTVTTISSLAAALCGVILIIDSGRRR